MSLWHCPTHGLVGPGPCCSQAGLAMINVGDHDNSQVMEVGLQGRDRARASDASSGVTNGVPSSDPTTQPSESGNQSDPGTTIDGLEKP